MNDNELRCLYFRWVSQLVCDSLYLRGKTYNTLLEYLFERDFVPVLVMDDNRRQDGLNLRYRFAYENAYDASLVRLSMKDKPCSILEMMVALAQRIEESFMYDPDAGDRIPQWFWYMVHSLGLDYMDDNHFDEIEFERTIIRFINREYDPDGHGGLFILKDRNRDLRKIEIWCQACWFADTMI